MGQNYGQMDRQTDGQADRWTIRIQYNLSTPAEHGTDINGRISQDPEYRRSYHLSQNKRVK